MAGELKWRYCSSVLMIAMVMLVKCIHGSRDGQLSSYLKEVFLDESGMALNQMVVSNESGTDFVYIGGLSTLYQLDLNLALLQQESTVPSDSTSCENPECLYDTKILEIAPSPVGKLIQCGGPEGKCEFRNLMNISREFGYTFHLVVNEGMSVGVVATREFESRNIFMYVATSIDSNNPGRVDTPITQRELESLNPVFTFEFTRATRSSSSTVEYIQAIPWTLYNFFIVHSGSEQRRLGRLCSENLQDDLDAYSEIILSCQSYSILQSAYIDSNDVLYGAFTNVTHSALCSYAMTDIQERFVDTTCGCVISDDPSCNGTAISYLTTDAFCSPSPTTNQSRESIEANYQCGDDDQMLEFSYAQATSSLEGNLLGEALPGEDSSIITLQKENATVALVTTSSTSNTTLSKIHVYPNHTGRLYETVDLEVMGSVLTDVYINQESEELFTLTTKEVLKLAVVNCSQYKTFAGCIGLNHDGGDPFCGWCTLEQNCSRMNDCTSNGSDWRQYHRKCTTNDDEATCLEIDDPSEGIDCTVPAFPARLLTPMSECLPGSVIPSGTVCNYTCEAGYSLLGVDSIFCSIYTPVFVLPSCEDLNPPNITCSPNITVPTLPGRNYSTVTIPQPEVTDEVGTIEFTNASAQVDLIIGLHEITFQATDDAGNTAFCGVFVLVEDRELPNITCPEDITVPNQPGKYYANVTWEDPVVSDNSGQFYTSENIPSGTLFPADSTFWVNISAVDFSGNVANCSFNVTVIDDEAPVLTCSPDIIANTLPGLPYAVIVIPSPNVTDNSISGAQSGEDSIQVVDIGSFILTFGAEDLAGNQETCSVMITVLDAEAPNITCPDDIIRNQTLGSPLTNVSWPPPVIVDNSNFTTPPIAIPVSGSMFPIGTTVVNITASDVHENNATCTFTVTILDAEAPILNCPNISSTTDEGLNSSSTVVLNPTATDDVDFHLDVNCSHSSEDIFWIGDTTVNCSSTDAAGNTETCLLVVTVTDDEAPTISCSIYHLTTNEGLASNYTDVVYSVSADNVDTHIDIVCFQTPEDIFLNTAVNCSSTDAAGKNETCLLVFTLTGNEGTYAFCDSLSTLMNFGYTSNATVLVSSFAYDNVDGDLNSTCSHTSNDTSLIGNCSSTDAAGNTGTCVSVVIVNDDEAPILNCPNISSTTDEGLNSSSSVLLNSTATDNVDFHVDVICSHTSEDIFWIGDTTVNCSSTDVAGNTDTCLLVVTVKARLYCPENITTIVDPFSKTATVFWPPIGDGVMTMPQNGSVFMLGITPVLVSSEEENCVFYVYVEPHTCNLTSFPSQHLMSLSASNSEFDIPPEEQCLGESTITVNTTCEFGCDLGYNLIGNEQISCLPDGLSDSLPTCELVTCILPTIFPSFLYPSSNTNNCTEGGQITYNTSCPYECEVGYDLTGISTVTCLEDGEITSELPRCGIVQCYISDFSDGLNSLENTCDEMTYINYTESCLFACDVGYNLIGDAMVTCGEDALLSSDLPTCQVVTCEVPRLPPNLLTPSILCLGSVTYNTTCHFVCDVGYNLTGESSLTCLEDNTLSAPLPSCEVISCFIPELPPRLSPLTSKCNAGLSINYTESCSYSCNVRYVLVGSPSVTCLANTSLSDFLPSCEVVTCNIPAFPANLTTNNTQCGAEMRIDYNTSCMYECQPGYDIIRNSSITCQASGELSADLPTCEVIDICQRFAPCPMVSTCTGSVNSYDCECNVGYTTVKEDMTTFTCVNINECAGSSPVCDSNAVCRDLSGSYLCTCMEGFIGNGLYCEATEPCDSSPCLNEGTCTTSDDGSSYICTCAESYTDVNCNTPIRDQGPLAVITNPLSQMVDVGERVTFSCSFQNAQSYRWYKDSVPVSGSANKSPLVINPALAEDQGYYNCTAVGDNGTVSTTGALLTLNGVDNYVVMASFLPKTFNTSLLDRTSSYFQQLSEELIDFILTPLQNNFEATLAVGVNIFSSGSVIAEFGIYVYNGSVPDDEQLSIISSTITGLAEENPTFMDPASVQSFSAVTCPAGTYATAYGYVAMFDSGVINSSANSTDTKCPDYTVNRDHRIEAFCDGDTIRRCFWVPKMNCGRNLTADELLKIIQEAEVTAENAEMIVEEVAEITTMTETISTEGLEIVADILEDITEINSTDVQVTESVVGIASNIADLPEEELEMAEDESGAPGRVVISLEAQLAVVEVQNETLRIVEPNIAAEVLDVTADGISQGITVFMSATADGGSISDEDFQVAEGDLTAEPDALEAQATLFIPSVLADRFSGLTGRVVITTHLDTALFRDSGLTELNLMVNETGFTRKLNSRIIAASINNEVIEDLEEPVRIAFTPTNPNGTNATCVSYDFDDNQWSTRGCNKTSNDSIDRITCECNHLTNFGILMDIYGERLPPRADFILEIVSYVGCCMSIWGLVITILTYASDKKLRDRKPNQILLSLSSSLLCLYIVFLVMISLDTKRDMEEIPPLPCCILAGFLHYFTLSSLFWMGVEGYNMHILFVRVLNTYLPRFMRKASLIAWGIPMVIVGITGGAAREYYAQTDFCFLRFWPLIGGLLIPVGFIMIFNIVVFIRVIMRLNRTVKGRQLNTTEKRQRLRRFQNAVCILILMGLTWSLGYLSIVQPASEVIQGVFTILNSLQGYFIFMLYCVRQPQVRRTWRSQFSCCLSKSFAASGGFTSSSGHTNSTNRNSLAKLRGQRGNRNAGLISNSDSSGFQPETIMRSPPERLPRAAYQNDGAEW